MMKQDKFTIPVRILALVIFGLFLSASAFAQQVTVNGHVKDATGEAVIGATIRVNGQEGGTVSDMDGNFQLTADNGATLTISYIGYQAVTVAAAPDVEVTLQSSDTSLDDVVVIGYGSVKKSDLTGSVAALRPDDKNKGLIVNPQDMLSGKVAGVSVISNDGTPGGGAQIRIRGGSSLNASNDPLIVIDGMAMDNSGIKGLANLLSIVNPQDIATFDVLKDASATAIYGSRGSNGVIIITTKKGRVGQAPTVSYSGSATVSMKRKTLDVMDATQYRDFVRGMFGEESDAYNALGTADTDWQDLIYRTAISQDHNVTVSGALKWLPYRVSVGYTDQQGILKTSDFKRVTASLNLNPSLLDNHLNINLNARGMFAMSKFADTGAVGSAFRMDPTQDPYAFTSPYHKALFGNNMGQALANFGGYFEWPISFSNDTQWAYSFNNFAPANPLALLNERSESAYSRNFVGTADFDYKVHGFEDLRLHATLGADISEGTQYRDASPATPNAGYVYFGSKGSDYILKRNLQLSAYAQYYHDFNENQHFDIMAGYEWQHFWHSGHNDYVGYYPMTSTAVDSDKNPLAGTAAPHTPTLQASENYLVSFFGRANYILMNRYYLTATIRDDGSSRFKDHWALFPSFAFAWRIKDENKLKDIDWLSDLKLRLGWGMTGQQDVVGNDYAWIPSYAVNQGTNNYYPVIGNGALYRPNNYTPDLKWETTTTYNVGLDFGFWNQRLSGSVDWYYRQTTNLLNYAPTVVFSAYRNQAWQNIGSLQNTGVELQLSWRAIQTKDWNWEIGYNFTYNNNKITNLTGATADGAPIPNTTFRIGTDKYLEYNQEGYPTNSYYVYQQVYGKDGLPLQGVVVDRNGDGKITTDDKYFYKSPVAPVLMGLSSRLEYKNWDFGFSLRASLGNYEFNNVQSSQANMSPYSVWAPQFFLSNRPLSMIPLNWQASDETELLSDYFVQNGSFLKVDNITLGYSFNNLFKTGGWHGISGRVYGTASNLFTLTNYDGIDPEIPNGYDDQVYPRSMSFIFGLNLNF